MWRAIDILINNAGISYRSTVEHMDDESEVHQLSVNYLAPMALIRLVIPSMRERGFGKIINVSSVSGMVAMPTMASYSASKHALEGATEALWYELHPFDISVSLIQPGFIHSNSFNKIYFSKKAKLSQDIDGPYADYYRNMGPWIARIMEKSMATPESISKKIIGLCNMTRLPLWVPVSIDSWIFHIIRKIIPRNFFHRFMRLFLPHGTKWGGRFRKAEKDSALVDLKRSTNRDEALPH